MCVRRKIGLTEENGRGKDGDEKDDDDDDVDYEGYDGDDEVEMEKKEEGMKKNEIEEERGNKIMNNNISSLLPSLLSSPFPSLSCPCHGLCLPPFCKCGCGGGVMYSTSSSSLIKSSAPLHLSSLALSASSLGSSNLHSRLYSLLEEKGFQIRAELPSEEETQEERNEEDEDKNSGDESEEKLSEWKGFEKEEKEENEEEKYKIWKKLQHEREKNERDEEN
jgi:hypothetical protein